MQNQEQPLTEEQLQQIMQMAQQKAVENLSAENRRSIVIGHDGTEYIFKEQNVDISLDNDFVPTTNLSETYKVLGCGHTVDNQLNIMECDFGHTSCRDCGLTKCDRCGSLTCFRDIVNSWDDRLICKKCNGMRYLIGVGAISVAIMLIWISC